ncbi:putative membrane protein [Conyzicola nivalis]|uniref:Membrane protein n=1 Tax=Conyzicola nivalis TaxID=1477021 RepID=A0ABV2QQZ6_9MICO
MSQHSLPGVHHGNPVAARKRWVRWGALGAVVLVPLAFVGLFVGALSQSDTSIDRIPAAIVNEDSLVTTTAPDGSEQNVFAGRQLVTELTGSDSQGFDWTITNADDAEAALAAGEVYAILTVPEDFSTSVLSIQSDQPVKSNLTIQTDDAHSYLTGSVLQVVGQTMVGTFGKQITSQYISGLYSGLGGVGTALSTASAGAAELGTGATGIADGATQLGSGATQLAGGASQLGAGLKTYTSGVSSLSSGLAQLNSGAAGLSQLSSGVAAYTGGVGQLSGGLSQVNAGIQANLLIPAEQRAALQTITDQLAGAAAAGPALSQQTAGAITGLQSGIGQSASGAARLASAGPALVTGVNGLATGATGLATGASGIADGATQLATGAGTLSTGLADGAAQVPTQDEDAAATAEVAADPVTLSVTTANAVTDIGQVIATFLVPIGLWIGALAVFLVLRPLSRRALASTAVDGRLVFASLARASIVTGAQAVLLVLLMHISIGVGWNLLPATLLFSLLTAVSFTAFHYLLTTAFGRAGLVISLFLLAIQLTATGGIYPIEVLSEPFQAISPFLPLTYAVSGMQGIIAGGSVAPVLTAVAVLAGFGILSAILALAAIRRSRSAKRLGLTPLAA